MRIMIRLLIIVCYEREIKYAKKIDKMTMVCYNRNLSH